MNNSTKTPNCTCFVCGKNIYKMPYELKLVRDCRVTCSRKCANEKQSIVNLETIEEKLGIDSFKEWLEHKYYIEKLNSRDIAEIVYGKRTHGPNIVGWMERLGIDTRSRSDAVALQWEGNTNRKKQQAKFAKEKLSMGTPARNNLIKIMQTKEYRSKSSEVKMGKKNPMWKEHLTEADRTDRNGKSINAKWVRSVKRRDNSTCQCCGIKGVTMVAHHLNGFNWDLENRYNVDNGITLCSRCHNDFHRIYGNGDNTKEQFEEYLKNIQSQPIKQLALF